MTDVFSKAKRSEIMRLVRSKDTKPELLVRSLLHRMGFRFRLHVASLPGKPDIVLPKYRVVVLVHGCFWHGHECKKAKLPTSNVAFWSRKIAANRKRDGLTKKALRRLGWRCYIIWQCQIKDGHRLITLAQKIRTEA